MRSAQDDRSKPPRPPDASTRHLLRRLLQEVREAVRIDRLWRPGDTVVLACSAGVDSIAAMELLARLRPSLGHHLEVVQVEHGLREDSAAVTSALDAMAQRHCLRWRRIEAQIARDASQREAIARVARYDALAAFAAKAGAAVIATAHHADDQAETVLMRLCRGASVDALGAMRSARSIGPAATAPLVGATRLVRPLLSLRRADTLALAQALALPWVEDAGNLDPQHERNRMRHEVLPRLEAVRPGAAAGIVRSARHARDAARALDHWLKVAIAARGRLVPADCDPASSPLAFILPTADWPRDAAPLGVLLREVALRLDVQPPSERATRQVITWLRLPSPRQNTRIHALQLEDHGDSLQIVRCDVARPTGSTYLGHEREHDDALSASDANAGDTRPPSATKTPADDAPRRHGSTP